MMTTGFPAISRLAILSGNSSASSMKTLEISLRMLCSAATFNISSISFTLECSDPFTTISRNTKLKASNVKPDSGKPKTTAVARGWSCCHDLP
ncbi:unnamed protein product [Periconia digitata]|uniref:Uncharacterized protein n=1 Tax=Periconia digitata TaxID=1303443 RepID=A0A9W4U2K1_9PLEO|nr:unnamed protein product [Periconia digitata]